MWVDAPVSSRNTGVSISRPGAASCHARRAACTSSRSCSLACRVFFEGEVPAVQLVPQGPDFDRNALLGQALPQLGQGEIRLRCDPAAQYRLHPRQARPAMAPDLKTPAFPHLLQSISNLIDPYAADSKRRAISDRRVPTIQCTQHPLPQILRIRLHPCLSSNGRSSIARNVYT